MGLFCIAFTCVNLGLLALVFSRRRVYRQPSIRIRDLLAEIELATPQDSQRGSRVSVAGQEVSANKRLSSLMIDAIEIEAEAEDSGKTAKKEGKEKSKMAEIQNKSLTFLLVTVVVSFFFTTLGISTQFAISALYWKR